MNALQLHRFGVAFGSEVVLSNVCLDVPARGVMVLVGPIAAGKSTLFRTLAGLNDRQPALRTWGVACHDGEPLACGGRRPALVLQDAQFLVSRVRENLLSALPDRASRSQVDQLAHLAAILVHLGQEDLLDEMDTPVVELTLGHRRRVAIVRAALARSSVILVDEPTAGMNESAAAATLALLRRLSEDHAVVVSTHHRAHAAELGGRIALLAGGRVVETGETEAFLAGPSTEAGRAWLETGNCPMPSPSARAEDLADGVDRPTPLPVPTRRRIDAVRAPRGFFWLLEGQLAGMPRPGIIAPLEDDLDGLFSLGVDVLVTLEEAATVPPERLAAYGIASELYPVADMAAPSMEAAVSLCRRIDELLARDRVVAVHCLAGLGRTGTVLAAYAIWRGASAVEAIDSVRSLRARTIQSEAQTQFLEELERHCAEHPPTTKFSFETRTQE